MFVLPCFLLFVYIAQDIFLPHPLPTQPLHPLIQSTNHRLPPATTTTIPPFKEKMMADSSTQMLVTLLQEQHDKFTTAIAALDARISALEK